MRDIYLLPMYWARLTTESTAWKWIIAAGAGIADYVLGTDVLRASFLGMLTLVALDTVTGVLAARLTGTKITSAKFGRLLVKILAYCSVLLVVAIVGKNIAGLGQWHGPTCTAVLTAIILTESISIIENVNLMGFNGFGWILDLLQKHLNTERKDQDQGDKRP